MLCLLTIALGASAFAVTMQATHASFYRATAVRCSTPAHGHLESAGGLRGTIPGDVIVEGWVAGDQLVTHIHVLADGHLVALATPAVPRPDVDRLFPNSPNKNKGWSAAVHASDLAPGDHDLVVEAAEEADRVVEIASMKLHKPAPP
jgi:hypothetical protein